ncbi:MAG TPA: hypothetical protein QGH10_24320, partial [Armatimonadota bacterium]|nr:hypothetical protein [Armatimonadota bacterium]
MNCLALLLCALPISAQETQTEVLFPGRPSEMLDLARDGGRLQREFSAWALEETDDDQRGEVTRWAFTPRAETSFNDLFFRPERV